MKNALPGLIVSFLLLIIGSSCKPNISQQHSFSYQKVELECNQGWLLTVQVDGSGCLAYTNARNCKVWLPTGTFPFQDIKLLPAFAPQELERYPFRWTYTESDTQERRQYGLPDTSWGAQWFELAYHALLEQERKNQHQRRLRKWWKQTPPIGVDSQP